MPAERHFSGSQALRIDSAQFYAVAQAAKGFDATLLKHMRKQLRAAGQEMADEVKGAIAQIPSSGRSRTGIRSALQRGTGVSVLTNSPRTAGIRIRTSGRYLPAGKAPLLYAMNLPQFRHPVFPDPRRTRKQWGWAAQSGRPYFGTVIMANRGEAVNRLRMALGSAMDEVVNEIRARS